VDTPVSLYEAMKKADKVAVHTYSHPFNIPCAELSYFTCGFYFFSGYFLMLFAKSGFSPMRTKFDLHA
jgi:hypothetical protein